MAQISIAVEIDTNYIGIYLKGSGVVLHEPCIIAFLDGLEAKNIYAVGARAYDMTGRTPDRVHLVRPIEGGKIINPLAARLMLADFLRRVMPQSFFAPKVNALVTVPCGLSADERASYARLCLEAGLKDFILLEKVFASAAGLELPLSAGFGGFVVDIGGGHTDIAALALSGIISGCSVDLGGNLMDAALIAHVAEKYSLQIGLHTARTVRQEIGSLYPNDAADLEVSGIDMRSQNPAGARINAKDTLASYSQFFYQIAQTAEEIINLCPPEIAADIHRIGICVSGECAAIAGVEEFFKGRMHLPVTVSATPAYDAIVGAGRLLANRQELEEILKQI